MEKKFKEAYLAGLIEFEELDALVSRWNFSDDNTPLREEDVWIEEGDEALQEMLDR